MNTSLSDVSQDETEEIKRAASAHNPLEVNPAGFWPYDTFLLKNTIKNDTIWIETKNTVYLNT